MKRFLSPDNPEETVPVIKNHIFVYVTDYGAMFILKEIIISPGQHHWEWMPLSPEKPVDISGIGNRFSTFDNALNRAVNDAYCTVYEIDSLKSFGRDIDDMKYIDTIKTIYKGEESNK
jgi:hypothetical protein